MPKSSREPRHRACLPCRNSKHKCDDGDEQRGISCSRCSRNHRECTWQEPKKMGRPKKNESSSNESAASGSGNFSASSSTTAGDEKSTSSTPANNNSSTPPAHPPLYIPTTSVPLPEVPYNSDLTLDTLPDAPFDPLLSFQTAKSAFAFDPFMTMAGPNILTPEVIHLIDIFYAIPQSYIPILPPQRQFLGKIASVPPLLLNSVLAMASIYTSRPPSIDYKSTAFAMLARADPPSDMAAQVQHVQAMIILSYLHYGLANIPDAAVLSGKATALVVEWGWNLMDSDSVYGFGSGFLLELDTSPNSPLPIGHPASSHGVDELLEMKRRTFWETWALDILLHATSNTLRTFDTVKIQVRIPSDPDRMHDANARSFFPHRIKAFNILLEAVNFPRCTTSDIRARNAERVKSMDSMINNLMLECHGGWLDALQVCESGQGGNHWTVRKNIFFMSMLMLNAASIHVHHRYAVPELHFDFGYCSFGEPNNELVAFHNANYALHSSGQPNTTLPFPTPSVMKIVSAAKLIMSLFRHSHQSNLNGAIISPEKLLSEDILRHSPFCGCALVIAGFGSAIEVAMADSKWQALAAQSNLDAAKYILRRLKRLWGVAGILEGELEKCNQAVQTALIQSWAD